jgi:hypothetical protein
MNGVSYDDLTTVEQKLQQDSLNIVFAYDTMKVNV